MADLPARLVAHTPSEQGGAWHDLDEHSLAVSHQAADFAVSFGGEHLARVAGLLHDAGKAHPDFQAYLHTCAREPDRRHPTVDHKSAGAYIGWKDYGGLPLAQILHGHHGGLSDEAFVLGKMKAGEAKDQATRELWESFVAIPEIIGAFPSSEPLSVPDWLRDDPIQLEFFMRMIFSCLVDADWLDTERHRDPAAYAARQWTIPPVSRLLDRFLSDPREFVTDPASATSALSRVRAEVYQACVEKASRQQGLFRLTVPTGGGKTRSGLSFALHHAVHHRLDRVIVAVPYLTITDQTASEYRKALQVEGSVLEHHSGIDPSTNNKDGIESSEEVWRQLACQNWDHPLIVTTTIQLFESLLSNRTSSCRKLHNIANSVILIDEAQTLPARLRGALFSVLNELVAHYGVTVALTTATQPVLDTIEATLREAGQEIVEIAPDPSRLFRELKRVDYSWPERDAVWDWTRVAEEMRKHPKVLTVVNTISNASTLYSELADEDAFYLSTRLCQAHRRDVLARIKKRLETKRPCRVVSTQLIEAGVDISFPVVIRALAPFDRIVQAAGRCNREGELDGLGQTIVFDPGEHGGKPPGDYTLSTNITELLLKAKRLDPHDPEAFRTYFSQIYRFIDPDRDAVQEARMWHNFESVHEKARMFDDDTFRVYVRYLKPDADEKDEGRLHDARLEKLRRTVTYGGPIRDLMREAQPYLVNCAKRDREQLHANCAIVELVPDIWEWRDTYDPNTGIRERKLNPEALLA